jgi:hypothetical protein
MDVTGVLEHTLLARLRDHEATSARSTVVHGHWPDPPAIRTRDELVQELVTIEKERARLASREAEVLVALAGVEPRSRKVSIVDLEGEPVRSVVLVDEVVDLVAAATHHSLGTARRRLATARALHSSLPRTIAQLRRGRISAEHAEVISRVADGLPGRVMRAYEARVVTSATRLTPSQTGTLARRTRARLDRAGEEQRRQLARRHEDVRFWVEDDGLACMFARLPLADASRLHACLEARAQGARVESDATIGQRRVAALVEAVCLDGADSTGRAAGVEVQVMVDLATLAGLSDTSALMPVGTGSSEPITAEALRELLSDPRVPVTFRRLVVDPADGAVLDRGRRAYRVPDALRAFLVARDGTCRFPGCARRAAACDIDHAQPWESGGRTDRDNLGCLCRRHHVLKTHGGWSLQSRAPDGSVRWRGPDGRVYEGAALPSG